MPATPKVNKACDCCRKRKVRCAGHSPGNPCGLCQRLGVPCTYSLRQARKTANMASKQSFATESTAGTLGSSGSSYEDEIQPAPRPYTVPQSPTEVSVKSLYGNGGFHVAAHFPTYAPVHFGRHWDVASHHVCPASVHHPPPGAHTDNSPLCFPMTTSYKHGAGSSRSNGGVLLDAVAAEAAKAAAAAAACAAVAAAAYAAAACADISDDDGAAANTLLGLRHQAFFRGTCERAARVSGSSSGSSAQGYNYGRAFEQSGSSSSTASSSGGGGSSGDDSRGDGGTDSDGDGDFYRGSAVAAVPRKRSIEALSAAEVGGVSSWWARAPLPMRQHAA
eukprot:TRINITY_DN199_c2_g1_i1.p1 TRINITY_DN199_c2_g1~~TRINITY_DN199_c2_g1_i1.p1  ORF type:complete len:334 (-),score=110.37 TRINITY_DN199_c2_g1_i1:764-1765(-)